MGAFLAKPVTEKSKVTGKGDTYTYGGCSMQGWRVDMEDAHTHESSLTISGRPFPTWSFFAVFDGHAGAACARVSSTRLIEVILAEEAFKNVEENKYDPDALAKCIKESFLKLDRELRESLTDRSGSTCTALLITSKHFLFINCGDSRTILSRDKQETSVHFATADHKPTNLEEKQRITAAGGVVITQRINGSLAVSRALGDFDYKEDENLPQTAQLVSAEPDVSIVERDPATDQFICLACDGIYDVFSNIDLADYINAQMNITNELDKIATEVVDTSLHKGSRDNMSVILLKFAAGRDPTDEAREKDKQLEKSIESAVIAYSQSCNIRNEPIAAIMTDLMSKDDIVRNLPAGGGIHAKQAYLEALIAEKWPDTESM